MLLMLPSLLLLPSDDEYLYLGLFNCLRFARLPTPKDSKVLRDLVSKLSPSLDTTLELESNKMDLIMLTTVKDLVVI